MVKAIVIFVFVATFVLPVILSGPVEMIDDGSIEIPEKPTKRPNNGFSFLKPADDAIFNFVNKLVNTSYLSSRMLVNRVKAQSEVRKQIEDQVEEFLENLPTIPIPVVDDLMQSKKNNNVKNN